MWAGSAQVTVTFSYSAQGPGSQCPQRCQGTQCRTRQALTQQPTHAHLLPTLPSCHFTPPLPSPLVTVGPWPTCVGQLGPGTLWGPGGSPLEAPGEAGGKVTFGAYKLTATDTRGGHFLV